MRVRSFCGVSLAPLLSILPVLPNTMHATTAVHAAHSTRSARSTRLTQDCASALRLSLPGARITESRTVTRTDSARALGRRPYCRVAATVDEETHIVAMLPDDWLTGGS